MTHYLPMLLMFLAASSRTGTGAARQTSATPPAAPRTPAPAKAPTAAKASSSSARAAPRAAPAAAAKKQPIKPPATAEEAAAQAAVNAVIVDAIKRQVDAGVAMAQAPAAQPAQPTKPAMTIDVPKRSPQDAAAALRDFLRRTRKFGSKKSPVPEVKSAQADMGGLSVDGIVGPKTRARAKALGATLP
jgi:hypothetical protein